MKNSSPLRYPGGKSAMTGLLADVLRLNCLGDRAIAEPFAGGAGASLSLLYGEHTKQIFINDADPAIHDFWWTLTHRPQPFIKMLEQKRVSMAEWRRQRDTYRSRARVSRLRRGFAAFYLNRCNRSGIIVNGGPIGGVAQRGRWKLDARYTKPELRRRCEKVAEYRDRIQVSCNDGIDFIGKFDAASTFFFIDPPYFVKGPTLYMNVMELSDHTALAAKLRTMTAAAWALTYDDCPQIRRMYEDWAAVRPFSLRYAAAQRRSGREILITPKWMRLPSRQPSTSIGW